MSEFRTLINAWLDGVITRRDAERLNAWLRQDRANVRAFAEQMMLHQSLKKLSESESARKFGTGVGTGIPGGSRRNRSRTKRRLWPATKWGLAVSTLTLLIVAPLVSLLLRDGRSPEVVSVEGATAREREPNEAEAKSTTVLTPKLVGKLPAARFSRSVNVAWVEAAHRWSVGDVMYGGDTVRLDGGRVEIVFDSGAVMTLVGPAALDIESPLHATLHSGTATTRVENVEGGEFKILTPSTEVTDLGTEFGVRVGTDGKETDVVVFDGAVNLVPIVNAAQNGKGILSHPPRRLSIGEAVRVSGNGTWRRLVSVDSSAFPFGDRMFALPPHRPPVIVGVRDDLRSPESPKYYRIYHAGLQEDSPAFVDRIFEWNGVTEEGMPHFLRGADYVATFNDDKYGGPQITVQLSGPAMLYVLYDDRLVVPNWLRESFEETGAKIGLDGGKIGQAALPPEKRQLLGTGPGVSVDREYSIWRRCVLRAGPVMLGRVGPRKATETGEAMYGIAAQPL